MTDAHPPDNLANIRAILAEMAANQLQAQQASAERFRQIEAIQQETQALQRDNAAGITELRQSIVDLRVENASAIAGLRQENSAANAELRQSIADLRQENAAATAELRRENATAISELRQENATANADLRREIKANVDDVSAMIFDGLEETKKITDSNARAIQAWEQRLETERDETITVEVDTLNAIQTLQSSQDGIRTDVQTLTSFVRDGFNMLGQAMVGLRQELSGLRQELSDQIQNLIDITRDNTGRITRLENEDHH